MTLSLPLPFEFYEIRPQLFILPNLCFPHLGYLKLGFFFVDSPESVPSHYRVRVVLDLKCSKKCLKRTTTSEPNFQSMKNKFQKSLINSHTYGNLSSRLNKNKAFVHGIGVMKNHGLYILYMPQKEGV
ncbi:hypothetical protein MKW98_019179 [Papaver atlanticum]|uniref:Uncharacterized protein n=1 Tax=Papaver atlanticum TaxID=357466 RepID=A0AAD4TBS8_9MAGN|nr:hypothetical protein MKW98_019179 [Papaver atlanticum]